jgi:predicted ATP-dependent endonuclease of OLD family
MHISTLRIRHFRNFLNARFKFQKNVNTLVGENGSGKTNALYALRLLLDDSLSRNATYLRESDFCRALGNWRGHWIVISVDFDELDPSEGCQILKHEAGHMNGTETGTYSLYFRPNLAIRTQLFEMGRDGADAADIRHRLDSLTVDDYEPIVTGRATGDFFRDDAYQQAVGNFETLTFPDPNNDDQALLGVRMPAIYPEITCTFAPALRDVVSDLKSYRSNPLLALLRGTESSIQIEDAQRITAAVTQLNADISNLAEIKNIADGIQSTLQSTVGHAYSPTVGVESSLPDQMDKLLQRLALKVSDDPGTSHLSDLAEQGLGGANLIYLALKLLEYEVKLSSDRVAHFLLIEEPEAHIHTHIQKTLFENQSMRKTQVIVSTHSTHISSVAKIETVNVLARRIDHAEVFQPASGLDPRTVARAERYLDAVRSTLLFAKGVILVEGQAELVMIPAMIKAVFGLSPDEMGISVIAMDCAFFEHVAIVFHDDRVGRRCAIVTDLDRSLINLPPNPDDDNAEQKHSRVAEEVGERRRQSLAAFVNDNSWVEPFFATHTFEIDFLADGNAAPVVSSLDDIYQQQAARETAQRALEDADQLVSGQEILRIAKKVGKGWLALLVAERLDANTSIPEYILRSIAFAGESISPDVIKRMGLFRIDNNVAVNLNFPNPDDLRALPSADFAERYREASPDDQLTRLMDFLEEYAVA